MAKKPVITNPMPNNLSPVSHEYSKRLQSTLWSAKEVMLGKTNKFHNKVSKAIKLVKASLDEIYSDIASDIDIMKKQIADDGLDINDTSFTEQYETMLSEIHTLLDEFLYQDKEIRTIIETQAPSNIKKMFEEADVYFSEYSGIEKHQVEDKRAFYQKILPRRIYKALERIMDLIMGPSHSHNPNILFSRTESLGGDSEHTQDETLSNHSNSPTQGKNS